MHHLNDKPKPWTPEKHEMLKRLGAAEKPDWDDVALQCGHSKGSCRTTLNRLLAEIAQGHGVAFGKADLRNPKRFWSGADADELFRLRTVEGWTFPAIDARLGRSPGSSAQKFATGRPAPPAVANGIERRAIHAPKYVPEHTCPTAKQFGDPLPGRSALDRLRAGVAEPAPCLGRAVRYAMQVSLASEGESVKSGA